MHLNLTYSQEKPHETSKDIAALPIIIVSSIIAGSMIKIGQIYFEKYLNEKYGIQTIPAIPTIKMEQTIKVEGSEFNPYKKDNRNLNKKTTTNRSKVICPNGLITTPWINEHYKRWNNNSKIDSFLDYFINDKINTEYNAMVLKTQQHRRLHENESLPIIPRIPAKFNIPQYNGRQRTSKESITAPQIDFTDKDIVRYFNHDVN